MNRERILYEDNDIIVCHKAAGIATQTARVGQADMVSEIINYLTRTAQGRKEAQNEHRMMGGNGQPRNRDSRSAPYIGIVHRLDQPVEGILVFAKNKQAAAELSRQVTENRMEKYYCAVVCGREFQKSGELIDYLLKDGRTNTSRIVPPEVKDAKKAVLEYEISEEMHLSEYAFRRMVSEQTAESDKSPHRIALAKIRLHTGRHHQIRVQMSHAGMSLLGDYKYADAETLKISEQMKVKEIALCAYHLSFKHPRTGEKMQFQIKPQGKSFQNYTEPEPHNSI